MDPLKRRRLEERKAEMLASAKERARRELVRERTDLLDAHDVPYELLSDDRAQVEWVWRGFSRGGGLFSARIDWSRVPVREMGPESGSEDEEAAAWLAHLAAEKKLHGEVVLFTGNGADPAIRLEFAAIVTLPQVVTCGLDIWIACESGGWAIEFLRFEHGWWWGRALSAADKSPAGDGGGDHSSM